MISRALGYVQAAVRVPDHHAQRRKVFFSNFFSFLSDMQGAEGTGEHVSGHRGAEVRCSVDLWPWPATGVCVLYPHTVCYCCQCICTVVCMLCTSTTCSFHQCTRTMHVLYMSYMSSYMMIDCAVLSVYAGSQASTSRHAA